MSLFKVFDVSGSALSAQSVRLNVTASNMANANSASSSTGQTYRARHPVFDPVFEAQSLDPFASRIERKLRTVELTRIVEDGRDPIRRHDPSHPDADEAGFVAYPNVNVVEEMANMISASRSFQTNVEIMNASKQMVSRVLSLGR